MNIKYIIFSVSILLMGISSALAQVFKNSDLQITLLQDHVWVIETTDMTTMYLLEGTNKALLIDTGTRSDSLDKIISKITNKPLDVVITHAHGDHDGNVGFFKEICMHPADTVIFHTPYTGKVNFIDDGYIFDLGGKKIEVKYMPAHTPGSIIFLDRPARSCYTGDAFGSGQVWLQLRPYMPMKAYSVACTRMLEIMETGIDSIYCGHYPYLKSALGKDYIVSMKKLAESIDNGTVENTEPFPQKVSIGCDNPMIAREGKVAIVYDPEHVK